MFKLKFGIIWTAFVLFAIFLVYGPLGADGMVEVNGVLVPQSEFDNMLLPKLGLGIFLLVGIYLLASGAKQILTDRKTAKLGKNTYGIVLDVYPNGTYRNNEAEYNAKIAIIDDNGEIIICEETLGFDGFKVSIGQIYKVKYLDGDMNFVDYTPVYLQDDNIKQRLLAFYRDSSTKDNFVVKEVDNNQE